MGNLFLKVREMPDFEHHQIVQFCNTIVVLQKTIQLKLILKYLVGVMRQIYDMNKYKSITIIDAFHAFYLKN